MRGLALPVYFLQSQRLQLPTPEALNFMICLFSAELLLSKMVARSLASLPHFPSSVQTHLALSMENRAYHRQTEESFQRYFSCFAQLQVGKDEREGVSPRLVPTSQCPLLGTLWEAPQTPACPSE